MQALSVLFSSVLLVFSVPLDPLVDTDWLERHLTDSGIIIVDVRKSREYQAGHVPGSVNVPFSTYMVKKRGLSNEMPDEPVITALLANAGINTRSKVVAVGKSRGIGRATRFLFTLAYAGVHDTAILEGGMEKWIAEKRPLETRAAHRRPTTFHPQWHRSLLVDKASVAAADPESVTLCDFRFEGFFAGKKLNKRVVLRPGHLPGAVEVTVEDLLVKRGSAMGDGGFWTFKPVSELETVISTSVGISKEKPVISYCNTGVLSTLGWFVLYRMLGYENVSMYDGSVEEWARDPSASLEKTP
jgi:thiosulfate/3-mercaptopyruvate sulfurtransferase